MIVVTLIAAMTLTVVPAPQWVEFVRPEWTILVLIYWCMALPQRVGVGVAWFVGILVDVLTDTLLGEHALAFSVVAYITLKLHKRTRLAPVWQQALTVLALLLIQQLLSFWVRGMTGHTPRGWVYWTPALVGMTAWPPLFVLMRMLRRRFRVS